MYSMTRSSSANQSVKRKKFTNGQLEIKEEPIEAPFFIHLIMNFLKKYFFITALPLALALLIYVLFQIIRSETIVPADYTRALISAVFILFLLLLQLIRFYGKEIKFTWILMLILSLATIYFNFFPSKLFELFSAYQVLLILVSASFILDSFYFDSTLLKGAKLTLLIGTLYSTLITLGQFSNPIVYTIAYSILAVSLLLLIVGLLRRVLTSHR